MFKTRSERYGAPSADPPSPESLEAGHELRDLSVPWIAALAVAMGIGFLFMNLGLVAGFRHLKDFPTGQARVRLTPAQRKMVNARPAPPEPHLQVDPTETITRLRRENQKLLHSYGWADRQAGKARIPIEEAMDEEAMDEEAMERMIHDTTSQSK